MCSIVGDTRYLPFVTVSAEYGYVALPLVTTCDLIRGNEVAVLLVPVGLIRPVSLSAVGLRARAGAEP